MVDDAPVLFSGAEVELQCRSAVIEAGREMSHADDAALYGASTGVDLSPFSVEYLRISPIKSFCDGAVLAGSSFRKLSYHVDMLSVYLADVIVKLFSQRGEDSCLFSFFDIVVSGLGVPVGAAAGSVAAVMIDIECLIAFRSRCLGCRYVFV